MGAADAVPGVSGGTIALMTGVYEELIHALRQFGPHTLMLLFKQGIKPAWQQVHGSFLLALFGGVLLSLLTIANAVLHWMDTVPERLWGFFFGLVLATVFSVARHVQQWHLRSIVAFVVGTAAAYAITTLTPGQLVATPLTVFVAGMIAVCAMILPGISGSFMLLLMGMYTAMLSAIKEFQIVTLAIFASGCVIGLLSFSHLLSWMFDRFKNMTLALMCGFLLGSLNKVWPWKHTLETMLNRHGEQVPVVQENVFPAQYSVLTGRPDELWIVLAMMVLGALIVAWMDHWGRKQGVDPQG
ncbi:DUF368 domain-containing protein [Aestuariibacter halophilus]|uniref:DUF368 domain-containing protein n=2 Tax=Fluctibacter halophilus TaxID=226011 RepID=A0ABS8GBM6_9ALTE|nr:DUF368 domain-containing protein [Aestuariibacter halophilus]